jgi:cytochrome c nitrite reductase small subunit
MGSPDSPRRPAGRAGALLISALVGLLAGLGVFTALYAEGLSYLSNDPEACANCHIMWPQYEGWQKSSHHSVAKCVDCHLPHDFVGKWMAKAVNGYHHSVAFTLQNFHEPIQIKGRNSAILQENCQRCHAALVHDLVTVAGRGQELRCVHCHDTVGHGPSVGLGGPEREHESTARTLAGATPPAAAPSTRSER